MIRSNLEIFQNIKHKTLMPTEIIIDNKKFQEGKLRYM